MRQLQIAVASFVLSARQTMPTPEFRFGGKGEVEIERGVDAYLPKYTDVWARKQMRVLRKLTRWTPAVRLGYP